MLINSERGSLQRLGLLVGRGRFANANNPQQARFPWHDVRPGS